MFDFDKWQEIFATMKKNPLRTVLTAFGVFWGILMLIIMLGSGKGLQNGTMSDFQGVATNSFFVWAQKTTKPFMGMQPGRRFNYTNDDYEALKNVPELAVVCPRNQLGDYGNVNNVTRGQKSGAFTVMGDYPQINSIQPMNLTLGRFLNDMDIKERRKVVVIGKGVRDLLFDKNENPQGKYICINGIYFMVTGMFIPNGSGEQTEEQTKTIHLPFTTFQHAFNQGDRVGFFAISSRPDVPASDAEEKAIAILKARHKIAPEDQLAIGHWNMEKEFKKVNGLFIGISWLVWIVGTGTLLAGVIGVSNIMLIVVKERTNEIGIRRALGAPPSAIVSQIILESVFLTSFAGYFGLVAGVGLLGLVSSALGDSAGMFRNPEVDFNIAMKALAILVVAGALAGFMPAKRAISISTVDALRGE
ncbi:MAG: ABC transporter permease [Bacteroidota bacterium]